MSNPTDHGDLITKLGGPAAVASALEIPAVNVRAWRLRSRIPPEHWPAVIGMATSAGVYVSADWLMNTTPPRKEAEAA